VLPCAILCLAVSMLVMPYLMLRAGAVTPGAVSAGREVARMADAFPNLDSVISELVAEPVLPSDVATRAMIRTCGWPSAR
jgi:hypothetical protein